MAALDTSCLTGVIGLANCACPCLEDTAPAGYNDSDSGLYITDLVPMEMLGGSDKCTDPGNPWNTVEKARERGANLVLKDVRAGIMKRNQPVRSYFKGMIGEKSSRDVRSLSTTYAWARISSPQNRGGQLHITGLGTVFSAVGSVSVQVYDQFNNAIGAPISLTTVAGSHVLTAVDRTLNLWVDGAERAEYFLVYTVNQNNLPRATQAFCTPCNKGEIPVFSLNEPYETRKHQGANGWANWVMVGGGGGNSLTDFDLEAEKGSADSYMNGLTITAEFICDPVSSICVGGLDYNDPVVMSLAHAYRYASAIELAQGLIRSPEAMRNAAVAKEVLAVDIKEWWIDYQKNVEYVTFHANVSNSDCLFCKPAFSMKVQSKMP